MAIPAALLWPLIGAALGGGTAAARGGDVKKGAALGAAGGLIGHFGGGLLGGAGGAAGSGAGGAAGATGGAAGATGGGWGALIQEAGKQAAVNTATGLAMDQLTPDQPQMTQFADVPALEQQDLQAFLQELMRHSTSRR